jgi:hypothetical protein
MSTLNRRSFLRRAAVVGGAVVGLHELAAKTAAAAPQYGPLAKPKSIGYGELVPTASENTGEVLLELPPEFKYTVFGKTGSIMSDGRPTPQAHDGMAAFDAPDGIRLIRNHEVRTSSGSQIVAIGDVNQSYNPYVGGGTTTLVVDPVTRLLKRDFVSLSGTNVNCAGGLTPWGSWITCEETTARIRMPHGYCFEVPSSADGTVAAVPLKAMGRFVHEAIAIDPDTGIVYETEDRGTSGFYRFIPNESGNLAAGGRLQMLAIKTQDGYDTRKGQRVGKPLPVTWVDIDNPDPIEADTDSLAVFKQGKAKGGATFDRLEGAWYGDGAIYLNSTSGGDAGLGQVWEYRPLGNSGGQLTLIFESPSADILDAPDNICVSPRGGLVLCEDGNDDQYVRGLTVKGEIFDLARNLVKGYEGSEFAGATFSPDGQTLFFNIQSPGLTFAVWGPWEKGAL